MSIDPAGLWAFVGGSVYAGTRLSTALWGGKEIPVRAKKLAAAQFVICLIMAPTAGSALTPMVISHFKGATVPPIALMIGLIVNAAWPLLTEPKFVRNLVRDMLRGFADRISGGETEPK